jgi:hypothetical protein
VQDLADPLVGTRCQRIVRCALLEGGALLDPPSWRELAREHQDGINVEVWKEAL